MDDWLQNMGDWCISRKRFWGLPLPIYMDESGEYFEVIGSREELKSRAVDPALLMESLFRLTELESRISLNLNVLVKGRIPKVVGLAEALREWLRTQVPEYAPRFPSS